MRRRAFLASALTATSVTAAGCSAVAPRTEHTDPALKTDDNPRDNGKFLVFREGGTELAAVGVDPRFSPLPDHFHTSISHTDGTELQSLTQRFVALGGDGTAPQLSLQGPLMGDHRPHPTVSLIREGTAAVVEVHRFGEIAEETVFLHLPVTEWPESARRLVVESTVELAGTGLAKQRHVLRGDLEFEFPVETDAAERTAEAPG